MPTNRPTNYRRSNLSGNRSVSATQRRQNEAAAMRQRGMAYADIARALGYRGAQGAAEAVRAANRRGWTNVTSPFVAVSVDQAIATPTAPATSSRRSTTGRTFGIEAEFFGITPATAVAALRAAGINAEYRGYTHQVTTSWKIVTDASVNSTGTGTGGLELVSPILRGEAGLQEAATAVNALRMAGARVDRSCGLHVHVGMGRLSGASIMKILDLYAANQSNINGMVTRSRITSNYCSPLSHRGGYRGNIYDQFRTMTRTAEMKATARSFGRYNVVNINAYAKYGTLEFRQHQGTLNGEKVTAWVQFLMALIEKAVSMDDAFVASADLSTFFDDIALDGNIKNFLMGRSRVLRGVRA